MLPSARQWDIVHVLFQASSWNKKRTFASPFVDVRAAGRDFGIDGAHDMLIFWKARLAILAVPKTGTTALERALAPTADAAILNPPGLKHCTVRKFRRELSPFFEQKGKRPLALVAVMREPVDWLGSWYRYRTRPDLEGQPNSAAGATFDQFVDSYLQTPQPAFAKVGSQATFLDGGVDHLFAYTEQPALLAFLEERLSRRIDLTRENVSPPGETVLAPDRLAALKAAHAADFALWDKVTRGQTR